MFRKVKIMKKKGLSLVILSMLVLTLFITIPKLSNAESSEIPENYSLEELLKMLNEQNGGYGFDTSGDSLY